MTFAQRLASVRRAFGDVRGRDVPKAEAARVGGVAPSSYQKWEDGDAEPGLATIETLARFFGVHPGWLAFGWEPRKGEPPESIGEIGAAGREVP